MHLPFSPSALHRLRSLPVALVAAGVGLTLASCDNPACIFGGAGCLTIDSSTDPGGPGEAGASTNVAFPVDGEWVLPGTPEIVDTFPKESAGPASPIVIVFSESMNPQTALDGFTFSREDGESVGAGPTTTLVGDGRVLVLLPSQPLMPNTNYIISFAEGAEVTDLTGIPVTQAVNGMVGTFSTAAIPSTEPNVLMTYPAADAVGESELGEIVVVFDRQLDDQTVNASSFIVSLDDQPLDPVTEPEVLLIETLGSFPETRVYRWRHAAADGSTLALPIGSGIRVTLSPAGAKLADEAGIELAESSFDFDLSSFGVPLSGELASMPDDAFGLEHLVGDTPLMMLVELPAPVVAGDQLDILVFGIRLGSEPPFSNAAFERTFDLPPDATTILLDRDTLGLLQEGSPPQAIVADGEVAFAYRYVRGGVAGPVRLLDTSPVTPGIQDAVLDTVPPQFLGFGPSGTEQNNFRSDAYDLNVIGLADERLSRVEVTVSLPNGQGVLMTQALAPIISANDQGLFVAAAIPGESFAGLGPLDATLDVRLYDRALNPSAPIVGAYSRTGIVSMPATTESSVELHLYDAQSSVPLAGALVFSHSFTDPTGPFGAPDQVLEESSVSDPAGRASLMLSTVRENSITVDLAGYDLFTLQGVTGGTVSVPLHRVPTEVTLGAAQTGALSSIEELGSFQSSAADSRVALPSLPIIAAEGCSVNPFNNLVTCTWLPWTIHLGRLGSLALFATEPVANEAAWSATNFLRAFDFDHPRPVVSDPVALDISSFNVDFLLEDHPDPSERAVDAGAFDFDRLLIGGMGSVSIPPSVRIESSSPGVSDRVVVGPGLQFDENFDLMYELRAAYPGAVEPALAGEGNNTPGRLVATGAVSDLLFLTLQVDDPAGNRSTLRRALTGDGSGGTLFPIDVPLLVFPLGTVNGPDFSIVMSSVLPMGTAGLYSVVIGQLPVGGFPQRAWRLFRVKPAAENLPVVRIRVPEIQSENGMPLLDAALTITLGAVTREGFNTQELLWSRLSLEASLESNTGPIPLIQTP